MQSMKDEGGGMKVRSGSDSGRGHGVTREDVLNAIRKAARSGGRLTMQEFTARSGIRRATVCRYFPNWRESAKAAGVGLTPYNNPVSDEELLADWGAVARKLGKRPPAMGYRFHGRFSPTTFQRRFHK
ncbi:MAG TPA: hypothetical protein VHI52_23250 [Verrucomicrobiae bacterium]|nr:hypothetical protein [Verrucomicrobiae bacterium]